MYYCVCVYVCAARRLTHRSCSLKKIEKLKASGNANFSARRYADAIDDYTNALAACVVDGL